MKKLFHFVIGSLLLLGCKVNEPENSGSEKLVGSVAASISTCGRLNVVSRIDRGGGVVEIGAGPTGSVFVLGTGTTSGGQKIYSYNYSNNTWTGLSGGATKIFNDVQGRAWVVNNVGKVYGRNGSGWMQYLYPASKDFVYYGGTVGLIDMNGYPYKCQGSCHLFQDIGKVKDVTILKGAPVWLTESNKLYNEDNWRSPNLMGTVDASVVDIAGSSDGYLFLASQGVDGSTRYYRAFYSNYSPPDCWEPIYNSDGSPEIGSNRISAVSGNELWIKLANGSVRTLRF